MGVNNIIMSSMMVVPNTRSIGSSPSIKPLKNGVIKRDIWINQEMASCMIENISSFLWDEVMNNAIYTLNRYPTKRS